MKFAVNMGRNARHELMGLIRDGLENIVAAEEDRLRASEGGQDG